MEPTTTKLDRAARRAAKKAQKGEYDFANSKALFVLKIITMSFFILTCVIVATVLLARWISELNSAVKDSKSRVARAANRLAKFRRDRIKHILKLRKWQLKEEKEKKRYGKKHGLAVTNEGAL